MKRLTLARVAAVALMAWLMPGLGHAGDPKHMGTASCGNEDCHNAKLSWKMSAVTQNEFKEWKANDKHANAWKALQSAKSQKIAANLGLKDASSATECLSCHADNVAASLRGKKFALADGVQCEVCHGAAENWMEVHISGKGTHADNVAAGMRALEKPLVRAEVCSSCHVGSAERFVQHRLYGAGHPRLSFELDTYSAAGANHYHISEDYIRRKGAPNHTQTWALGQINAARHWAEGVTDPARYRAGLQPELAFFECTACHHEFNSSDTTHSRGGTLPHLNDANLVMAGIAATRIDATLASRLTQQRKALEAATTKSHEAIVSAATALVATLNELETAAGKTTFSGADTRAYMSALGDAELQGLLGDYPVAEQVTQAASSFITGFAQDPGADAALQARYGKGMSTALDALYANIENPENYRQDNFVKALKALLQAAPH